jgi:AcrR family transcriptional regulator
LCHNLSCDATRHSAFHDAEAAIGYSVAMAVGLRERKKEQTRRALADAALELFVERGFDATTVEEIAAACDVSPRTFFRYFACKEDVLFEDGDERLQRLVGLVLARPGDEPPFTALAGALLDFADEHERRRRTFLHRYQVLGTTESLRSRQTERQVGWESALAEALRQRPGAKRLDDLFVRVQVATATAALRIAMQVWAEGEGRGDFASLLARALEQVGEGRMDEVFDRSRPASRTSARGARTRRSLGS